MKFSTTTFLSAVLISVQTCNAIPLLWSRNMVHLEARRPQSYSVVPVDGGSPTATAVQATKTVTDAVTIAQTQTTVVLSTVVATPQGSPSTPQTVTLTQSGSVVTVQPSVSAAPYDDGQWHTTYFFKSTITPSANIALLAGATTSTSSVLPSQTVDLGQWAPWANATGRWR